MGLFLILFGFASFAVVRAYENGAMDSARAMWRSMGLPARFLAILAVVVFAQYGGSKNDSPLGQIYRLLFWSGGQWMLQDADDHISEAVSANSEALGDVAAANSTSSNVTQWVQFNPEAVLSFDWHSPDRLPEHDRQNVLARTVWVTPTNIAGVLYEDHYVAFNAAASTNPAVILIEYAGRGNDGTVVREQAETVTNSYPNTVVLSLQSGSHTCYWFRCNVPVAFTNRLRDWNGEAIFGAPDGSGKGFDLLGTIVIDDGGDLWLGATTNMVIGSITNTVKNGIILE